MKCRGSSETLRGFPCQAGQTGASGDRLKEGCAINKSLPLGLRESLAALEGFWVSLLNIMQRSDHGEETKGRCHIKPYVGRSCFRYGKPFRRFLGFYFLVRKRQKVGPRQCDREVGGQGPRVRELRSCSFKNSILVRFLGASKRRQYRLKP